MRLPPTDMTCHTPMQNACAQDSFLGKQAATLVELRAPTDFLSPSPKIRFTESLLTLETGPEAKENCGLGVPA